MRIPSYIPWLAIILLCAAVVWFLLGPVLGFGSVIPDPAQAVITSGSLGPGGGGLYQEQLPVPVVFNTSLGDWNYTITAQYRYTIIAMVVTRRDYTGQGADQITPVDFGIACCDVIRPENFQYFTFSADFRKPIFTYRYPPGSVPLPVWYVQRFISNNHLVFLNDSVYKLAQAVQAGDCVVIRGYLVDITGTTESGGTYSRSTSVIRNDAYLTGCETVLVESLTKVKC